MGSLSRALKNAASTLAAPLPWRYRFFDWVGKRIG
jgi:hypothetical protein